MGKIRTFLSLNINSILVDELKSIQDHVKDILNPYPVRWENPEKLHLTLRFLGDIDEDKIDGLAFTLERLKLEFDSIKFTATGIDFFPNHKYPNVVFIGLNEDGNNSEILVSFIDKIIYNFGVKPDKRFIPHITLGRFSRNKRVKLNTNITFNVKPVEIFFDSFYLMQSVLTPKGSIYNVLNNYKFNN